MKKLNLEPGKKYRGYGTLNEYGEFEFVPEDTGAKAGAVKQVTQGKGYVVSESKQFVLVHLKIKRSMAKMERVKEYLRLSNQILTILHKYAF